MPERRGMEDGEEMEGKLTPKQEAFVNAYTAEGCESGTAAAIAAGYGEKGAAVQAVQLLRNPKVQAAIEARRKPAQDAAIVDASFVLQKLKETVLVNCATYTKADADGNVLTVQVNAQAATSALKTLAACLGLGKEKAKDETINALANSLQEALRAGK